MTEPKLKRWTCSECGATGEQATDKAATAAWNHHYLEQHQDPGF